MLSGLRFLPRRIRKLGQLCFLAGIFVLVIYKFLQSILDLSDHNLLSDERLHRDQNRLHVPVIHAAPVSVIEGHITPPVFTGNNINMQQDHFNNQFYSDGPEVFWRRVDGMVSNVSLYPDYFNVTIVLNKLVTSRITGVQDISEGVSYKWLLELEGKQRALFKPQLVPAEEEENKDCGTGHEQGAYEVAAFHLFRLMGVRTVPFVAGRKIHISSEILPFVSRKINNSIEMYENGTACIRHRCYSCPEMRRFCFPDGVVRGSISLWVNRPISWYNLVKDGINYHFAGLVKNSSHVLNDQRQCNIVRAIPLYSDSRSYMDLMDMVIFDHVIANMDRKHTYIRDDKAKSVFTIHMDHGLAFCDREEELSKLLLALNQCCRVRRRTLEALRRIFPTFKSEFRAATEQDELYPLLTEDQLDKVLGRIENIFKQVDRCLEVAPESIVYNGID